MFSMFLHPFIGMLKFCIKLITSAISSVSSNFRLMASIYYPKRNCGKFNARRRMAKEFSIFGIVLQGLHSKNHHVTTYGKQSFISCLSLLLSDLWSREVAPEPDNIDITGEKTNASNRFALLSYQSTADFKYNKSLIFSLLHQPLKELYLDTNIFSFSIYRNQTLQSHLTWVNHESLVETCIRSKVVRILF